MLPRHKFLTHLQFEKFPRVDMKVKRCRQNHYVPQKGRYMTFDYIHIQFRADCASSNFAGRYSFSQASPSETPALFFSKGIVQAPQNDLVELLKILQKRIMFSLPATYIHPRSAQSPPFASSFLLLRKVTLVRPLLSKLRTQGPRRWRCYNILS